MMFCTTPRHTTLHVCCVVQIDKTFRRKERQASASSSNSLLSELLETKMASGGRPYTLDHSAYSSSPACSSEAFTVGDQTQVWDALLEACTQAWAAK